MSDPRPDPGSDLAGESEYGNDTGFATEATSTEGTPDGPPAESAGLTAEDDPADPAGGGSADPTTGPADDTAASTEPDTGPGDGGD